MEEHLEIIDNCIYMLNRTKEYIEKDGNISLV
jgi:hypothetical protein